MYNLTAPFACSIKEREFPNFNQWACIHIFLTATVSLFQTRVPNYIHVDLSFSHEHFRSTFDYAK